MTLGNFVCCRDKELTCYVCVSCLSVFHKSCQKRKIFTVVEGHKIVCSTACEEKYEADPITVLQKEILELRTEAEQREEFINRQKRGSQAFEDDVVEIEGQYRRDIKKLTELLSSKEEELTREQGERARENEAHFVVIQSARDEIQELGYKIRRMNLQNSSLQSAVSSLEAQLRCFKKGSTGGVRKTHEGVLHGGQEHVFFSPSGCKTSGVSAAGACGGISSDGEECIAGIGARETRRGEGGEQTENLICRRPKILILADEYGRNLNSLISDRLYSRKRDCTVETFIKPGAGIAGVLEDTEALTRTYGSDDHVVIMAGATDVKNGGFPSFKFLLNKIRNMDQTNVTLISIPYFTRNREVNDKIFRYNNRLNSFACRLNGITEFGVFFLDSNLKRTALANKRALSIKISDKVLSPRPIKNLVYVRIQEIALNTDADCRGDVFAGGEELEGQGDTFLGAVVTHVIPNQKV